MVLILFHDFYCLNCKIQQFINVIYLADYIYIISEQLLGKLQKWLNCTLLFRAIYLSQKVFLYL